MKQTLLPQLCHNCALSEPPKPLPDWLASRLTSLPSLRFRNPDGCEACTRQDQGAVARRAWNGYVRQTAVAEMIRPDIEYLSFVRDRDPGGAWRYWLEHMGGVPIGTRIWKMVAAGDADPFDALIKGARIEQAAAVL